MRKCTHKKSKYTQTHFTKLYINIYWKIFLFKHKNKKFAAYSPLSNDINSIQKQTKNYFVNNKINALNKKKT